MLEKTMPLHHQLGPNGERNFWIMPTGLVFVAIVAVVIGLATHLGGYAKNTDPDPFRRSELAVQYIFESYGETLHLMGDMKTKCGHLLEPETLPGCTNLPPSPPDTSNIGNLEIANNNLIEWVTEQSKAVNAKCLEEQGCREWFEKATADRIAWCCTIYGKNQNTPD